MALSTVLHRCTAAPLHRVRGGAFLAEAADEVPHVHREDFVHPHPSEFR
jgi:hypothetical protein